jgi:LAO/AO transport system kinase
MVDFFLLLMLAGAGDELQGIKRGIMEMADMIAITKADGSNRLFAEGAKISYQNALQLFSEKASGWQPKVVTCSALENRGIKEVWSEICDYAGAAKSSDYFYQRRREQAVIRMHSMILESLNNSFYNFEDVRNLMPELESQLYNGTITSYKAAQVLLEKYFRRCP